jgi:hypothetical protein
LAQGVQAKVWQIRVAFPTAVTLHFQVFFQLRLLAALLPPATIQVVLVFETVGMAALGVVTRIMATAASLQQQVVVALRPIAEVLRPLATMADSMVRAVLAAAAALEQRQAVALAE